MRVMPEVYTHGHHESVLRSHKWRTAENSAAYLLPHLAPDAKVLDVGCGPGTITADLAGLVPRGSVTGIDSSAEIIEQARAAAGGRSRPNLQFATGDVYALDFPDASFDVVHAHQVLQHLTDPVAALRDMRRVLRQGGILAVRDSDYGGFVWAPADPLLDRWMELYHSVCSQNGAEADAGRHLLGWAHAAGFSEIQPSSSTWTFADTSTRLWWADLWADRVLHSAFAEQAVNYGLSSPDELRAISKAWRRWAEHEDAFFAVLHAELIARR